MNKNDLVGPLSGQQILFREAVPGCTILLCVNWLFLECKIFKLSNTSLYDLNRCCKCPHICGCWSGCMGSYFSFVTFLAVYFLLCVFKCVCLGYSFLRTNLRFHTLKHYYLGSSSIFYILHMYSVQYTLLSSFEKWKHNDGAPVIQ